MFILSTKTNGKTLIYQKPSARGNIFFPGITFAAENLYYLKSFRRKNNFAN